MPRCSRLRSSVSGWAESEWGFRNSAELDALALLEAAADLPILLEVSLESADVGQDIRLTLSQALPDERIEVVAGVSPLWILASGPGLGLRVVNPGVGPAVVLPASPNAPLYANANGRAQLTVKLPPQAAALSGSDLFIQAGGALSGFSTPVRLRVQ